MINYEAADSPFFKANKAYCESIEAKLKIGNIECSGFCNSYGYVINTTLKRNNLTYNLLFLKNQSTQNGVVIPVNAIDYAGIEVTVTGLNKKFKVTLGKSALRRLFTSKKNKSKIPAPYFIKINYTPDDGSLDDLNEKIREDQLATFKLSNGTLVYKLHTAKIDPLDLITEIEKMTAKWL